MRSTSGLKQQTSSTDIKRPTQEYWSKKHVVIPFCFSLVIILFFFTFCDFKVVGDLRQSDYPASEATHKSVTGFKFITGTSLPMNGVNREFVAGLLGIENEQAQNPGNISFNIWALLALAAAIGGIVIYGLWKNESKQSYYSMLLAATGAVALSLLMSSVGKYEGKIDLGFVSLQTKMVFQLPYWLALLSFATAGFISFLRLTLKRTADTRLVSHTPTPIYVSIITQDADTTNTS
jgi:hypothetical protein